MKEAEPDLFTLSDIRAIRYLVIVMGGIAVFMFLVTDRESPPMMVVGFISVVTIAPLSVIYFLRRAARAKTPNKAPEPTPTSVMPRANERESK